MTTRGIRGATSAHANTAAAILDATRELLLAMMDANPQLRTEDMASVILTLTDDLNAAFPAKAARELGWMDVPLLCSHEINVPGSVQSVVRILIHWNTKLPQNEIHHVYLHEAIALRPDRLHNSEDALNQPVGVLTD